MKTKLMMFVAAVGMAFAAQAATKTVDGVTYTYEGGTITKVEGDAKVVNIPATLDGIAVKTLGGSCFANNMTMMRVSIPGTVTSIGAAAFNGCVALVSVAIPSGVTTLGYATFYNCSRLRQVILPNGLKSIGDDVFFNCGSLKEILLPSGLESIGADAFEVSGLCEIDIPDTVVSIGNHAFSRCSSLTVVKLPVGLSFISHGLFYFCGKLVSVNIPHGVTGFGNQSFCGCSSLRELVLPSGVDSVGESTFSGVGRVVFEGKPPQGFVASGVASLVYPKAFGAEWKVFWPDILTTGGYANPNKTVVTVVSSKVRENNPTVLDVVYKVTSTKPTVKVRVLAFEDGERTLNKVTRPETFIEGTAANLGDAIAPNVEHKLSWQVSSDFKTDLAKMKFEVLAVEDGVLPLEFISIPANGANKKMQLSWNLLTEAQVFDALLWLYADKDAGLMLADGVLKRASDSYLLGYGTTVSVWNGRYSKNVTGSGSAYYYFASAIDYVFSKMGFSVLSGDKLTYANEMTRLGLNPSGIRQYAWRELND